MNSRNMHIPPIRGVTDPTTRAARKPGLNSAPIISGPRTNGLNFTWGVAVPTTALLRLCPSWKAASTALFRSLFVVSILSLRDPMPLSRLPCTEPIALWTKPTMELASLETLLYEFNIFWIASFAFCNDSLALTICSELPSNLAIASSILVMESCKLSLADCIASSRGAVVILPATSLNEVSILASDASSPAVLIFSIDWASSWSGLHGFDQSRRLSPVLLGSLKAL